MRKSVLVCLAVLLVTAGAACAGTYNFNLPMSGHDYNEGSGGCSINMGMKFTSVSSVSLYWKGTFYSYDGGYVTLSTDPITPDYTDWSLTMPDPGLMYTGQAFDATASLVHSGNPSYLVGKDQVNFVYNMAFAGVQNAYIHFDTVRLTVDGTPVVPEPSSFLALGAGILGLLGIRRKKL